MCMGAAPTLKARAMRTKAKPKRRPILPTRGSLSGSGSNTFSNSLISPARNALNSLACSADMLKAYVTCEMSVEPVAP